MALQVGDTIRVQLVCTVAAVGAGTIDVDSFGGTRVSFPVAIRDDRGFAWEKVAAPEPAYRQGELYRDADGSVWLRRGDGELPGDRWTVVRHPSLPTGRVVAEGRPLRPLTRLVPETP